METIENEKLRVSLTRNSAAVHKIEDKHTGFVYDLVLPCEEDHLTVPSYAGNTVGSYAGRMANAHLIIDGTDYQLDRTDRNASLHGGLASLRREWDVLEVDGNSATYGVKLSHMEDGLPGNRTFTVRYILEGNELRTLSNETVESTSAFNFST